VLLGALGDIHGAFADARRIIERHPDVPAWLCVGDIAGDDGAYLSLGAPIYWTHGNNDNFDAIAANALPEGLRHIANGTVMSVGELRIAGLGGTFAPSWYPSAADALPHPVKGTPKATALADKRRHFVREDVDACTHMRDIDVFLTHEAAKPFRPYANDRGPDAGKEQINDVLRAMQPRLHLFGHHHRFSEQQREGVRSVGLDLVSRSYLLVDARTLEYERRSL
jgi:Icc-related predicted phosphoesterase